MDAQNSWNEIKETIRLKWSKLSNTEIENLKNNLDGLVTKLQINYGYARPRAEREYHEFRVSLRPLQAPGVLAPVIMRPKLRY
jgi:hypothetical protein